MWKNPRCARESTAAWEASAKATNVERDGEKEARVKDEWEIDDTQSKTHYLYFSRRRRRARDWLRLREWNQVRPDLLGGGARWTQQRPAMAEWIKKFEYLYRKNGEASTSHPSSQTQQRDLLDHSHRKFSIITEFSLLPPTRPRPLRAVLLLEPEKSKWLLINQIHTAAAAESEAVSQRGELVRWE